jgi:hypothetical protein
MIKNKFKLRTFNLQTLFKEHILLISWDSSVLKIQIVMRLMM